MKLIKHIEEYLDLKKEGFKLEKENLSGMQGQTTQWEKKHSSGHKTTIFNKSALSDVTYPFEINTNLSILFSEIASRKIITMINTAWRAFGYSTDIYKIPAMHGYSIDAFENKGRFYINTNFQSSSFNNVVEGELSPKQAHLVHMYRSNIAIFNILLGNKDTHDGNFVVNSKKKRLYSIDFGLAFVTKYKSKDLDDLLRRVESRHSEILGTKKTEQYKKLYAKQAAFLELFIEHNRDAMLKAIDDTANEISRSAARAFIKHNPDEELEDIVVGILGMFQSSVEQMKKTLLNNINVVKIYAKKLKGIVK